MGVAAEMDWLVIDSSALLDGVPIDKIAKKLYTVHAVLDEIRDEASRKRLAMLTQPLIEKEPSEEAVKCVVEFSKKTGDYASLSAVDLKLLALTYMLEMEANGVDHLRTEPKSARSTGGIRYFVGGKEVSTGEPENEILADATPDSIAEDDDDAGWITPDNISSSKQASIAEADESDWPDLKLKVGCVTGDFAMQVSC